LNSKIQKIVLTAIALLTAASGMARGGSKASQLLAGQSGRDVQATSQDKPSGDQPSGVQGDKKSEALKKYLEAQRLEKANNYTGAVNAYKDAIGLDPASAELRVALGSLYLKNRNFIDAEAQAREALKVTPGSIDARRLYASVYVQQTFVGTSFDKEKAKSAIDQLQEIIKISPTAKVDIGNQEVAALAVVGELYSHLDDSEKAFDAFKRLSEADASSDVAFYSMSVYYFSKAKYREAAEAARRAYDIAQKPLYADRLAQSLMRIGRTQEALGLYKKAIGLKDKDKDKDKDEDEGDSKDNPMVSPLLFNYAEALVFAGQYDEAKKVLDPVLKGASKQSAAYLRATEIATDALRRAGKRDEAVKVLQTALTGQDVSESLPLLYALAETYGEMQQFGKAIDTYEEALKSLSNPDGTIGSHDKQNASVIMTRIALAYRLQGKPEKQMETYEKMKKALGADSPQPDEFIIDTLIQDGKNKEALDAASTAAVKFPNERQFKLLKAQAAGRLGDMRTAEATLQSLMKQTSEDSQTYSFLSSIQLEANQLKESEENARKAVSLDPKDIDALVMLSIVQEREKKYKDSEATLRKAIEIDPDNATLLNNLGYYLTERGDRLQEAEELIRRAVNIVPTNGSFLDSLGWLFFKQGKTSEAQKYLEQAVFYSPRSGTIHDHVGDLNKKLGNTDKARAEWETALKLSTDQDEIKKIKDKLGKLK
jgi:tetratricopeptide (TPR) repeat protein